MADKVYSLNFHLSDGSTKSVQFTATQGPRGEKGDTGATGAGSTQMHLEVTLPPENWTGEEGGPYTQRVYHAGITEEDRPHYGPLYSGDRETQLAQKESWAMVDDLDTETDYLTFTCLEEKPRAELTVSLEVTR